MQEIADNKPEDKADWIKQVDVYTTIPDLT